MEFFIIEDTVNEGHYYDLKLEEDTFSIGEGCLLPTKELAEEVIENHLSVDYEVKRIELISLDRNGTMEIGEY